ncbi:MAG: hypothetical protein WAM60_10025 [Candidatus Promineifilaceae bacterium]
MKKRLYLKYPLIFAFLLALGLLLTTTRSAFAHTRVEAGPYLLIIGWENEPPVVGDRNFLTIEISKDGQPMEQVEATLDLRVVYGDKSFSANLNPTSTPGLYKVDIYPTVRGEYTVEFTGSIEDTPIDISAQPEEVLPAAVLQFPEAPPETTALQSQIDDLSGQLQTARMLAIGGIVVGVVGLAVGAVGLLIKRS